MWTRVRCAISILDPVRVENKLEKGTPDVNYVEGFIELKWVRHLPKRGGVIRVEHYTQEQKTWARRRHLSGGRVYLLLKVAQEWLLFRGHEAAECLGVSSIEELRKRAMKAWPRKLDDQELRSLLTDSNYFQESSSSSRGEGAR